MPSRPISDQRGVRHVGGCPVSDPSWRHEARVADIVLSMVLEPVSVVAVEAATGHPRELHTAEQLRELLATYDLAGLQWTSQIVVQHRVVPRSHPTLTLNTRSQGDHLLATYLHEQMHWWTAAHPSFGQAIAETRALWPEVPDAGGGGSHDEHSTRLHLIVCHLERRAMQHVVGSGRAAAVLERQINDRPVYPWVYGQIHAHEDGLDQICSARDLWPTRLASTAR